ncbi:MAG: 30S ribosomal protein S13 [Candidatus Omnitrophica bacterium]|nr:30S ribosomal protein S13 [Candidatus Omnitrophota bacterium]
MPRILGIDVPKEKRAEIALTYIYGIGRATSNKVLSLLGVDPGKRAKDLSDEEVAKIASYIQKECRVEGDLRREISGNIKRLVDISSYRGIRHKRGLPVRGQRTKTNARTRKGPRKTVGVIKTKEAKGAAATKATESKA